MAELINKSFKTNKKIKAEIVKIMKKQGKKSYCKNVVKICLDYIDTDLYKEVKTQKSEIGVLNQNPTKVQITKSELKRISKALNYTNRNLNELINMILIDYIKRGKSASN